MRSFTSLIFVFALTSFSSSAEESKIEFDKPKAKTEKNPSSPEAGAIAATGTFRLANGYTLDEIRLEYRRKGQTVWKTLAVETNEKKGTWKKSVQKLAPGTYEVRVFMGLEGGPNGAAAIWNPDAPKNPPYLVDVK